MEKNFCIHLNYYDDFKLVQYGEGLEDLTEVFILCKYSFENQNVNISNLIQNPSSVKIPGKMKLNFSAEEIIKFKNAQIDFYILDKERLDNIFAKIGKNLKSNSNILMADKNDFKILYFQNELKYISFTINKNQSHNANLINLNNQIQMNNNINFPNNNIINDFNSNNNQNNHKVNLNQTYQPNHDFNSNNNQNNIKININQTYQPNPNHQNNANSVKNDPKLKIIQSLILLYGNVKEINRMYTQGTFDVKKYYLVNKTFIDKFKEIYNYNEINNILTKKGINTLSDAFNNLKGLISLNEIKSIYNKISININNLTQINIYVQSRKGGPIQEYNFPLNFEIIHESILNIIKSFINIYIESDYEISFGQLSLCLRWKYDPQKIYIYNYNNHSFNLSGIIELFADAWKYIYDKHISKKSFVQYLTEKQINLNILNQRQNLTSTGNKFLGYIYLTSHINDFNSNNIVDQNMNMFNNPKKEENKNMNLKNIYQNLINSLKNLKKNNIDLPNLETIKSYISSNILNTLPVFIIEHNKMKYYLENTNAFYLLETEIISGDLISEATPYSFINEEIIKYFNIQNTERLPKAFAFVNKNQTFLFYPNQNCLLIVFNYKNNSFNLKKFHFPSQKPGNDFIFPITTETDIPPIPIPKDPTPNQPDYNHTLGLENIGATCYMNATLQCLCHVSSLKDYFLDDNRYYQEVMTKPTARLTQSLAEVVRKLWSQTTETYYAPRNFKNIISQMNPLFQGIQANDSKDLVLFIFENIHNELNNPSQNPTDINLNNIRPELYQFRQNYYSQNYSIISQIFYYEQSSIMKCLNCGFETYNFNIMNMIIFPLEKVRLYLQKVNPQGFGAVTLYDCFDQNEQIEMLEGANQIYCNSCRQNSNATSSNKLYTCPEVLTIILNRGKGLEFEVEFSFPMTISIEKYVTDKTCDPNYELIGVLTHHGPSGMAGHFVAYCKSPVNSQWYFYNDATVTQCSSNVESEMQSKGIPYILFYQRRKTKMVGNYESKCIYFAYEGKEGYYDYTDDNKMLYEVYSEFRSKYDWAPEGGHLMLTKNDNMTDLDEYKSLRENGINDKDKICIIKD